MAKKKKQRTSLITEPPVEEPRPVSGSLASDVNNEIVENVKSPKEEDRVTENLETEHTSLVAESDFTDLPDENRVQIISKPPTFDLRQYDRLPCLFTSGELKLDTNDEFDLEYILSRVQKYSFDDPHRPSASLSSYLTHYHERNPQQLKERLNEEVKGFPAIFYIVETNNVDYIREWIKYGGDPNATHGPFHFPVLAFAILRGADTRLQATETIVTLLRLGASPRVIPEAYYEPFGRDLGPSGPKEDEFSNMEDPHRMWCTPEIRPLLGSKLTLTQRYRLWQARILKPASGREKALAFRKDADAIIGIRMTIIGQAVATWSLRKSFLTYLAMPNKKPLVLLFAGPRGHGKRELAKQLGHVLHSEPEYVDCSTVRRDDKLFGSSQADGAGSLLNYFLATKTGKRSIVFMDEFDKPDEAVCNTLLMAFYQGEYIDRRNGKKVDCSQTIWILSTSKFDQNMPSVGGHNTDDPDLELTTSTRHRRICRRLRQQCAESYGARLANSITEMIPFEAFDEAEQAVLVDKCIMDLETKLSEPVVTSSILERLVGNIRIKITEDATVCSSIAKNYYLPELAASSILHGVNETIARPLIGYYLEDGDEFSEDQPQSVFKVGVNDMGEVEVSSV